MYICMILLLTVVSPTSVSGMTFEEAAQKAQCLSKCVDESCWKDCEEIGDDLSGIIFLKEKTAANVRVHCAGPNILMIAHDPGLYVIEINDQNESWTEAYVKNGTVSTFGNLSADTSYAFHLHKVKKNGLYQSEVTPWFSTEKVDYKPGPVRNISVKNFMADDTDVKHLQAEIVFEPEEKANCYFSITIHPFSRHDIMYIMEPTEFRSIVEGLRYNTNYTGNITSYPSKDIWNVDEPNKHDYWFMTPLCLDIQKNTSVCPPDDVKGLDAKVKWNGESSDIIVWWEKSKIQPELYHVEIEWRKGYEKYNTDLTVPGNTTEVFFPDVGVRADSSYRVVIVAESNGRRTVPLEINRMVNNVSDTPYSVYIGIAIILLVIALLMTTGSAYTYCRYVRRKRCKKKVIYFETFKKKDGNFETEKDKITSDYMTEINEKLLVDEYEVETDKLQIKQVLGSGAFGVVRLGTMLDKFDQEIDVAIKMLNENPTADDVSNFQQEIMTMKFTGKHPNIVSFLGCCTINSSPMLIVEYCSRGDLQSYLRRAWEEVGVCTIRNKNEWLVNADAFFKRINNFDNEVSNCLYDLDQDMLRNVEPITAMDLLNFGRQVAIGMEFLSLNRIVHRDLATRNVLVSGDKTVKISDFGLSRDIYQENIYRKQGNGRLPIKWMAIESLTHQVYTTQSDVWSFGILLWEIVTLGGNPYPGTPTNRVLKLLQSGYRMDKPENCGIELYQIMLSCWNENPRCRPSFTELKENLDKLLGTLSEKEYLTLIGNFPGADESSAYEESSSDDETEDFRKSPKLRLLSPMRYVSELRSDDAQITDLTRIT
ncbi:tyrosine-protein kinase receptor torso isoform X2 [Cephus cinctus]|uniref:receptor protein-tyrosine kinase n=1 Tax=Cephus cinctus TaxID=211228 RepID=A0AAJ7FV32_CEPCN|nr:tyrosine-protein kinase receptor torso isoform X2 [Cephus cinctus]